MLALVDRDDDVVVFFRRLYSFGEGENISMFLFNFVFLTRSLKESHRRAARKRHWRNRRAD